MRRGKVALAEATDRLAGHLHLGRDRLRFTRELCLQKLGKGGGGLCGVTAQAGSRPRRPQQHLRADSSAGRQAPPPEPRRHLGEGGRERDRKDERQQRGGSGRGEVAIDRPREEDRKAHDGHCGRGHPRVPRAQRPDDDVHGAGACQSQEGEEPAAHRTGEIGQHQHREGSERSEDCGLRIPDHLVGEREDGGHDDRRSGSVPQCRQARV